MTRTNLKDKTPSTNLLYRPCKTGIFRRSVRTNIFFYEQHPWERSSPEIPIENTNMSK